MWLSDLVQTHFLLELILSTSLNVLSYNLIKSEIFSAFICLYLDEQVRLITNAVFSSDIRFDILGTIASFLCLSYQDMT